MIEKYKWSKLHPLQVGKYGEYFVKMEFTSLGYDVYTTEVDNKGIDFIVRTSEDRYYDVQVKAIRGYNYIYFLKNNFSTYRENLLAALVIFMSDGELPNLYLIPSKAWREPNALLVSRDYGEGKKSKPDWGINLSKKNEQLLSQFAFDKIIQTL
jgi:hypothetical protein